MVSLEFMVPFYGPFDLLRETVESVLSQSDPDWSLTVVDDADPQGSRAQWFEQLQDSRVRYLRNESNLGSNRNFQRCLDLAQGDLVVFLGCDDVLLPHYASTVRAAHEQFPGAAMIQPGVQIIGADGRPARTLVDQVKRHVYAPRLDRAQIMTGEALAVSLLRGNWLYFPSLCWRREVLARHRFEAGLDTIQDLALIIDLVLAGESLAVVPSTCFRYRRHAASESSWRAATGTRFEEERRFFHQTGDRMAGRGWRQAERAARRHLSSRLNALTLLPSAARARERSAVLTLTRHVVGGVRARASE